MNKVINGKRYDTNEATRIGEMGNGKCPVDVDYYRETLYRKRNNEYFLHIEGNARSWAAHRDGLGWVGGSAIEPVSMEEALAWAGRHIDADGFEEAFGKVASVYINGTELLTRLEAMLKVRHDEMLGYNIKGHQDNSLVRGQWMGTHDACEVVRRAIEDAQ